MTNHRQSCYNKIYLQVVFEKGDGAVSYELNRKQIGDHIWFSSVSDSKFKHNRLSVNFVLPLSQETAADYAVVPFVLRKGCRECPDFTTLNARLAELYGAVLDADVSKYGAYQILEVSIRALDNRFALEHEDIVGQCAALLAAIVLDPKWIDNAFDAADVALERQYIVDTIDAEINEKRTYAMRRCLQIMCEGEPAAIPRYGTREQVEQVTPQSAAAAYRRMLHTAAIEILFTGSGDPASAERIFAERMRGLERGSFDYACAPVCKQADRVREVTETMDITQGKMVLGLRTGPVETPEQTTAMRVFAAMYGGTPFSKLFLNVREKLSLCYYCASRYHTFSRLLTVDSGVEFENKEKAQKEILAQLQAIQEGKITEEELRDTKLLMKNAITSTTDSLGAIETWYLAQILRGQSLTPAQDAANIDAVTLDQVVQAAQGLALDTVYFLTGNSKEGE